MSLLEAFGITKIEPAKPDEIYPLILNLVKDTKRVSMRFDSITKRLGYFESMIAKHHVIREVQVYDD
jgi:hypothetical protein